MFETLFMGAAGPHTDAQTQSCSPFSAEGHNGYQQVQHVPYFKGWPSQCCRRGLHARPLWALLPDRNQRGERDLLPAFYIFRSKTWEIISFW